MYYIAFSIGLIIITIFFASWSKLAKFRKQYSEASSFGLALVATFIGVFLAIYFTNYSEEKKEIKNVINLLDATSSDLQNNISHAKNLYTIASRGVGSVYTSSLVIKNNPLRLSTLYQSIVNDGMVLRHFTPRGTIIIQNYFGNIVGLQHWANEGKAVEDSTVLKTINFYIKTLEYGVKIITLEKRHLEGGISDKEIDERYNQITFEFLDPIGLDLEDAINQLYNNSKK